MLIWHTLGPEKKMLFVSIWFSFALSLFLLNTHKKRITFEAIPNMRPWKAVVLLCTGFIGGRTRSMGFCRENGNDLGLCSAFSGSGADIT